MIFKLIKIGKMLRTMLTRGKVHYDYGFSGKESTRMIHIQKGLKGVCEQEAEEGWAAMGEHNCSKNTGD